MVGSITGKIACLAKSPRFVGDHLVEAGLTKLGQISNPNGSQAFSLNYLPAAFRLKTEMYRLESRGAAAA